MENVKIERMDNTIKVIANDSYKITNSKNDYYSDFIFLPFNYNLEENPQGIRAVGYGIWGQFLEEEIPKNKVEELQQQINILQEDKENLEFVLLDTNFRLTCMELKDEGILEE